MILMRSPYGKMNENGDEAKRYTFRCVVVVWF